MAYRIAIGDSTSNLDPFTAEVPVPINGAATEYAISLSAGEAIDAIIRVRIGWVTQYLGGGGNVTVNLYAKTFGSTAWRLVDSEVYSGGETFIRKEFRILLADTDDVKVGVVSLDANDTTVGMAADIYDAGQATDANGRVDLGSALGEAQTVSATGKKLMVDMYSSGDATPMSLTDILGKVYEGLSSVVTDIATADSTTSFTVASGSITASAYLGQLIAIEDADDDNIEVREIIAYTSSRVVTVNHAFSFTPAVDDAVWILNIVGSAHQLNTAIPGSPAVNSINEKLKILPSKNLKSFMDKH